VRRVTEEQMYSVGLPLCVQKFKHHNCYAGGEVVEKRSEDAEPMRMCKKISAELCQYHHRQPVSLHL